MSLKRYLITGGMLLLATGCAGSQLDPLHESPSSISQNAGTSGGDLCPANPSGSGILPDGDFSHALDPGDKLKNFVKPAQFAPGWMVQEVNIDFYGSTAWKMDGYCSVDLDGSRRGGIDSAPFATTKGTKYYVSFLLSGNGGSGPKVKRFRIQADGQSEILGWNIRYGNTVQNGKFATTTWSFTARSDEAVLAFLSLDRVYYKSGAVIAAISVDTTPPSLRTATEYSL